MIYVVGLVLLALGTLNVVMTLRTTRDEFSTPLQKVVQLLVIWLLPFIGALVVWRLLWPSPDAKSDAARRAAHGLTGEEHATYHTGPGESALGGGD